MSVDTTPVAALPADGQGHQAEGLSEAELAAVVARVGAGDQEALGRLYREMRPSVQRYLARRMGSSPADVEDLVQETFLRAGQEAAAFAPDTDRVGAWLCGRVAHRTMRDFYRTQWFGQRSAFEAAVDVERRAPFESAQERESRPLSPRVVTALARLTPAQRRAVQLRYLDGYSTHAAAEVAGSTPRAVVSNSLEARRRLATQLADLAPEPVSALVDVPKHEAVRVALAQTANNVAQAQAWLREQGVQVDESYLYQVRLGKRTHRGEGKKEAVLAELAGAGVCDSATIQARLRERGIEVDAGYINTLRRHTGAAKPPTKHSVVRAALAELGPIEGADTPLVQARLREQGIEVSASYVNQVRRTPAVNKPFATPRPSTADTAAGTAEASPAARVDSGQAGSGRADSVADALARARAAVSRIPAARVGREGDPNGRQHSHGHDGQAAGHDSDHEEIEAGNGLDRLGVSA